MSKIIFASQLFFISLITLVGCMTNDKNPHGFTKMKETDMQKLEIEKTEKLNDRAIKYFIVAKLKSVNEQPQEYLELKSKRFSDRSTCVNWVSDNNQLLTRSLQEHVRNRKKGYFVDNIKCLRTALLVTRYDEKAISI